MQSFQYLVAFMKSERKHKAKESYMEFKAIDKKNWNRTEYFDHYFSQTPCTYSITTKIEITQIKKQNQKLYPAMLYCITKTVNQFEEFRTSINQTGELGIFDSMLPCYTVFHKDMETFSNIWTEYSDLFPEFLAAYEHDMLEFGSVHRFMAKPNVPENHITISMIPWTNFDGFHLNIQKGYQYLLPIFTMGKYVEHHQTYVLPLSIQVHHAVCDGFHVSRFIQTLQDNINNLAE